jgi:hypothetical protein
MNAASGGKSLGALRAMHGRVAAGKITDISFDDAGKRILVAAKIVDDEEWRKVEEGVYTGFSQGGRYVRRWADPGGELTRYTAEPSEISLVDLPCVPAATFEVIKNGVAKRRAFAAPALESDDDAPEVVDGDEDGATGPAALAALVAAARALSAQLAAQADALDPAGDPGDAEDAPAANIAASPPPPAAAEPNPFPGLAKALGETAALRTRLDEIAPGLAALAARLEALEAQPLPARAALRAVAKSADGAGAEAPAPVEDAIRRLAALPAAERAHALTRISLANPLPPRF